MVERILQGDCAKMLKLLEDKSVDTCVTSPPYYGLRDYGVDGQIGLEETPEEYVGRLVEVFREVRRVLRDDGTLWLNIGDSYAGNVSRTSTGRAGLGLERDGIYKRTGGKPKDLIGIPWLLAFALRDDGWYLRQDIIWHKPNPMPESVKDRCTKAHEYIFLLSKKSHYYFDYEAIQEVATGYDGRSDTVLKGSPKYASGDYMPNHNANTFATKERERWKFKNIREENSNDATLYPVRNKRDVWTVPPKPVMEAHFATYPEELIEPCILAGSRAGGIVLDPFFGSGTTGRVALKHGRGYIGIELNPDYIEIERRRLNGVQTALF